MRVVIAGHVTLVFPHRSVRVYQRLRVNLEMPRWFRMDIGGRVKARDAVRGAEENAGILVEILSGKDEGPRRDMVIFNAAAAMACAGLADHLEDRSDVARGVIADGSALERLRILQDCARH